MSPKDPMRYNPLVDILSKEQEFLSKRSNLFKNNFRHPFNIQDFISFNPNLPKDTQNIAAHTNHSPTPPPSSSTMVSSAAATSAATSSSSSSATTTSAAAKRHRYDDTVVVNNNNNNQTIVDVDDDDDNDIECHPGTSRSPQDNEPSVKRSKDNMMRYPLAPATETSATAATKRPASSSSGSSGSPPPSQPQPHHHHHHQQLLRPIAESMLLQETIEEETKCIVCNATFPSVWLLEQHAALQHANLGPMEEKPFICDQCGQSYRYRSAYVKHREQNHRARLPADKLFTCDVCGMQFRYLKSFKKHRLNHALERLHGKNERRAAEMGGELVVSSSNEAGAGGTMTDEIAELQFAIKTEDEEEDQDDTIDSPTTMCAPDPHVLLSGDTTPSMMAGGGGGDEHLHHTKISSTEMQQHQEAAAAAASLNAMSMNADARNYILKVIYTKMRAVNKKNRVGVN